MALRLRYSRVLGHPLGEWGETGLQKEKASDQSYGLCFLDGCATTAHIEFAVKAS